MSDEKRCWCGHEMAQHWSWGLPYCKLCSEFDPENNPTGCERYEQTWTRPEHYMARIDRSRRTR